MQEKIASITIANTNDKGRMGIQMNLELPLEDEQHTREILTNLQSHTGDKFYIFRILFYSNTKKYEKFRLSENDFTADELITELKSLQIQIEEIKETSRKKLIQNLRDDKEIDIAELAKSARHRFGIHLHRLSKFL